MWSSLPLALLTSRDRLPNWDAQDGSSETATFPASLNQGCSDLYCTGSTPLDNNTPQRQDMTRHPAAGTFSPRALCADWEKPRLHWRVHRSSSDPIYILLTLRSKSAVETTIRASGIRSNATKWLTSPWSDFLQCRMSAPHILSLCHLQEHPLNFLWKHKHVFLVYRTSSTSSSVFIHSLQSIIHPPAHSINLEVFLSIPIAGSYSLAYNAPTSLQFFAILPNAKCYLFRYFLQRLFLI